MSKITSLTVLLLSSRIKPHACTVFKLHNELAVPVVGFGTAGLGQRGEAAIGLALQAGFRHIDTAAAEAWYNESAVANAIRTSGIPRAELFITTKIHPQDFGLQATATAVQQSLIKLQTDYVDLVLLHTIECWEGFSCQADDQEGSFVEAWKALEQMYFQNIVKSIGVSNFVVENLEHLNSQAAVPIQAVQNFMDPLHQDRPVRRWCEEHQVLYTSYSTLGIQHQSLGGNPVLTHPTVRAIAEAHSSSPVVAVLAWALQEGVAVIPRSSKAEHIQELSSLLKQDTRPILTAEEIRSMRELDASHGPRAGDEL